MLELFDYIGFYGPVILFMTNFYYLFDKRLYLLIYLIGSITNITINEVLKIIIREPRPNGQIHFVDSQQLHGPHLYGMPSAHTQSCIFSACYIYLVTGYHYIFIFSLFISAITFYQRWKFNRHSINQLAVGSLIGAFYAWVLIYFTQLYYFNYNASLFMI